MPTVRDIIRRLFPKGTNPATNGVRESWKVFPFWPPDMFAVTATIVSQSGLYCRPSFAGGIGECAFTAECVVFARRVGPLWAQNKLTPPDQDALQALWKVLHGSTGSDIIEANCQPWWEPALKLLLAADEASEGVGFGTATEDSHVAERVLRQHRLFLEDSDAYEQNPERSLPYIPNSLCLMVPSSEVCVQPKSRTAQLGCTLRSLTHHLALLPTRGEVSTSWIIGFAAAQQDSSPLNLLLVPFPYRIQDDCFDDGGQVQECVVRRVAHDKWEGEGREHGRDKVHWSESEKVIESKARYFRLNQGWLTHAGHKVTPEQVGTFLKGLMGEAKKQRRDVNGIILPELALDEALARQVADELANQDGLELFITGISSPDPAGQLPRNQVLTCIYVNKRAYSWVQSKHHRWRIDKSQIEWNLLEDRLLPEKLWWEMINIEARTCGFYAFRHGASLATLICEDLARIDPVQGVIRSVGPNLVIALLMDGPQLERRWPGRYATVLADDPGCAVLSFSSLGLMRRSAMRSDHEARQVALWKDADGKAHELILPSGSHALVLPLSFRDEANYSLDGRSDGTTSVRVTLERNRVRVVTHPGDALPWLDQG